MILRKGPVSGILPVVSAGAYRHYREATTVACYDGGAPIDSEALNLMNSIAHPKNDCERVVLR